MTRARTAAVAAAALALAAAPACSDDSRCGPTEALVASVIDGDTVVLADGTRVRYLLADAPEISGGAPDCYGPEARELNVSLVDGARVELAYDQECEDRFGRLLAYVSVDGRDINALLIERGFACVLYIAPNDARRDEYQALEDRARLEQRGMWGACEVVACD